jgi:ribosomal protein S18 acetylase RimI-like enzyme
MENKLPSGYRIVELSNEEFEKHWNVWGPQIFKQNDTSMDLSLVLSEEEKAQFKHLNKNLSQMIRLNLCVFHGDEFCGWFTGGQHTNETFYMRNSAILPAHRRKGLYSALMFEVLNRVRELGFQNVFSRHTTVNNAIIIPKLKAGFMITGIEVSERFGTLVHLTYHFNETRRRILEFRAGELKPDRTIKKALGIE